MASTPAVTISCTIEETVEGAKAVSRAMVACVVVPNVRMAWMTRR